MTQDTDVPSLRTLTASQRSLTARPVTSGGAGVTRGAGSPAAALAMVFKLVESAQERRRAITGASLVALVRSGVKFENGFLVERDETVVA